VRRVEPGRLHHVDGALDRFGHVPGVRRVPGEHRVEAVVEGRVGMDAVQADAVAELA